eukprot:7379435-Prymnesium_polylepis.1
MITPSSPTSIVTGLGGFAFATCALKRCDSCELNGTTSESQLSLVALQTSARQSPELSPL